MRPKREVASLDFAAFTSAPVTPGRLDFSSWLSPSFSGLLCIVNSPDISRIIHGWTGGPNPVPVEANFSNTSRQQKNVVATGLFQRQLSRFGIRGASSFCEGPRFRPSQGPAADGRHLRKTPAGGPHRGSTRLFLPTVFPPQAQTNSAAPAGPGGSW